MCRGIPEVGAGDEMTLNVSEINNIYSIGSPLSAAISVLYGAIIFPGLCGNALIVIIVYRKRSMHTPTNLMLVNIAVADVISLLLCPVPFAVSLSGKHPSGQLGQYLCTFLTGHATTAVTVSVTYLTIVLLAVERYHGIVKPFKRQLQLSKGNVMTAIVLLWLVSVGLCTYPFIKSHYDHVYGRCLDPWTPEVAQSSRLAFICLMLVPGLSFCLLFFCYFRIICSVYFDDKTTRVLNKSDKIAKRRIVKVLLSVTVAFHICYAPFLLFELVLSHMDVATLVNNYETLYTIYRVSSFFIYLNSCLNPFLYGFQSSAFRQHLRNIFHLSQKRTRIAGTVGRRPVAARNPSDAAI